MNPNRFIPLLFSILTLPALLGMQAAQRSWRPGVTPTPPGYFQDSVLQPDPHDKKWRPSSERPGFPASTTASSDHFGYSRSDAVPFSWYDAQAQGFEVTFDDPDDSFSAPIPIGFDFKFYENNYNQLFVSTNGLALFGEGSEDFENEVIPLDAAPDNLIAPFWDDLVVEGIPGGGKVYVALGGAAPDRFMVVEWYQVVRRNQADRLTFQLILFESGDIEVRYLSVNGILDSSTVGIEDSDGLDGLLYLYNAPGISSEKAIRFYRPGPSNRAKMLPNYASGFLSNHRVDFLFQVRNTGDSSQFPSDVYDLSVASSDPRLTISLITESGSPLQDTDQDGLVDTGAVTQGDGVQITARLQVKETLAVGEHIEVLLTARSSHDLSKTASTQLQTAEPAFFAQAFGDYQTGLHLNLIGGSSVVTAKVAGWISGSNVAIAHSPAGSYVYTWERRVMSLCSDIEYAVVDQRGILQTPAKKLTNNCMPSGQPAEDHLAAAAVAPNEFTAVVWVRDLYNQAWERNSNVFLALLGPDGEMIGEPINLTGNSGYFGAGVINVPLYTSPFVIATGDSRFVVVAADQRVQTSGETSDIVYTVLNSAGSTVKQLTKFTHSTPGSIRYVSPTLTELVNSRALLAYTTNNNNTTYSVAYAVLDSSGNTIRAATAIPGTNGWGVDAIQLSTGRILLSWIDPFDENSVYYLLNDISFSTVTGPVELTTPDLRRSEYASVTRDSSGNAVLTWVDSAWLHYLYYALINDAGNIITPPMRFYSGQGDHPIVISSAYGLGNAPLEPNYSIYLPLSVR